MTASAGSVGRREHFVHANLATDDRDEVGEGAAGVDSDEYRGASSAVSRRAQQDFEVERILCGFECEP